MDGSNVVALAPTGSGKTLAPVTAFAYARSMGIPFADRLIYALPQRTLAMALRDSVAGDMQRLAPNLKVTIQTGNVPEDPYFEGDVVFTTIDQLLSAYIEVPVSLPGRLANLPAGALLGALIVFDEFHLLEPGRALATALDMARELHPYSRTLLMSATFPRQAMTLVCDRARARPVEVGPDDLDGIPSQRNKRRVYVWHSEPLTAKAVVDAHRSKTIVVVNRVDRAQDLYDEVLAEVESRSPQPRVILLHSRFLRADREAIERELVRLFGRGGDGQAILIATSVVEVGLDISADTLHTEVATAAAIFQRAGRCARFENEAGIVHVYALESTERGPRYGPYGDVRHLVDAAALQMEQRSNRVIGFVDEREVVDLVHAQAELDELRQVLGRRRMDVVRAQQSHQPACVRELIRQSDSVSVLISGNPEQLELSRRPETFSLPRVVLRALLSRLDLVGKHAGKVMWPEFPEDAEGYHQRPSWKPLATPKEADGHFFLALHPSLASYDREHGLRLLPPSPGDYESRNTLEDADGRVERLSYRKEPFRSHAVAVLRQMEMALSRHQRAVGKLAARLRIQPREVEDAARFVALAHDMGKLSDQVQLPMQRWMSEVHGQSCTGFLAHTTYDAWDPRQQRLASDSRYRRAPHAVEGAWALRLAIGALATRFCPGDPEGAGAVARAIFSAMARHHSPGASRAGRFALSQAAAREALAVLRDAGFGAGAKVEDSKADPVGDVSGLVADPGADAVSYHFYLFLVRLLRLADQRATAGKE